MLQRSRREILKELNQKNGRTAHRETTIRPIVIDLRGIKSSFFPSPKRTIEPSSPNLVSVGRHNSKKIKVNLEAFPFEYRRKDQGSNNNVLSPIPGLAISAPEQEKEKGEDNTARELEFGAADDRGRNLRESITAIDSVSKGIVGSLDRAESSTGTSLFRNELRDQLKSLSNTLGRELDNIEKLSELAEKTTQFKRQTKNLEIKNQKLEEKTQLKRGREEAASNQSEQLTLAVNLVDRLATLGERLALMQDLNNDPKVFQDAKASLRDIVVADNAEDPAQLVATLSYLKNVSAKLMGLIQELM